jgi:hypothetical protein
VQRLDRLFNHLIVFLGLAILVAMLAVAAVAVRTSAISREAAAYVEVNVPQIVNGWNPLELERRLVPEMVSPRVREGLVELFSALSSLGKLKELGKPTGRIGSGAFPGTTIDGTWADYAVDAEFDHGRMQILLILARGGDGWRIAGFSVRPATLSRPSPPQGPERS